MDKLFHHKIEEINENELKIYGDYFVDTAIIIKKTWISWLINNIRKWTPQDFNNPNKYELLKEEDSQIIFYTKLEERDFSRFIISPDWKNDSKNNSSLKIPFPAPNERLIMEYIEPLLCDLAKYLPEEEQKKLEKPWACNMTIEEWNVFWESKKNGKSKIKFVEEIDPKDYFG